MTSFVQAVFRELRRIWSDLREGKNLDVYPIAAAAFIAFFLSLLTPLVSEEVFHVVVLAGVGFLSTTALISRRKTEKSVRILTRVEDNLLPANMIYENWHVDDVTRAIRSARSSVIFVTTWVSDVTSFVDAIKYASSRSVELLDIEVFMLDPESPFAAQRRLEMGSAAETAAESYKRSFGVAVELFGEQWGSVKNASLTIYKYDRIPTAKILAVDNWDYIVSWFPLGISSGANPCFHVAKGLRYRGVPEAAGALDKQILRLRETNPEIVLRVESDKAKAKTLQPGPVAQLSS